MTTLKPTELCKVNALQQAVHARGDWHVWVENDVPLDHILTPGYWANHARHIKPGDQIEVKRYDMSLDVILRAVRVIPGAVVVRTIYEHVDDKDRKARIVERSADDKFDATLVPEGYKLGHSPRGAHVGHFVQLKANGEIVAKGLASKRAALEAAIQHATISAGPDASDQPDTAETT